MKQAKVLKASEAKVEQFIPRAFNQNEETFSTMYAIDLLKKRATIAYITQLAKQNSLNSSDEAIAFANEIINRMLDEIIHDR